MRWQFDWISQGVTGTNIQKTVFKKRDFFADLFEEYLNSGATPLKKRDAKAQKKASERSEVSDEEATGAMRFEAMNETVGMQQGEKLIEFKSSNSMNNMLPSVRSAREEAREKEEEAKKEEETRKVEEKR